MLPSGISDLITLNLLKDAPALLISYCQQKKNIKIHKNYAEKKHTFYVLAFEREDKYWSRFENQETYRCARNLQTQRRTGDQLWWGTASSARRPHDEDALLQAFPNPTATEKRHKGSWQQPGFGFHMRKRRQWGMPPDPVWMRCWRERRRRRARISLSPFFHQPLLSEIRRDQEMMKGCRSEQLKLKITTKEG